MVKKVVFVSSLVAVLFFFISLVTFADVYTWRDKDGKIHVTAEKPPEGVEIIKAIVHPTPTETPKGYRKPSKPLQSADNKNASTKATDPDIRDRKVDTTPTPYVDSNGHDEAWWRNKKQSLLSSVERDMKRLKEIDRGLYFLNEEALYDDPKKKDKLLKEKETVKERIESSEQKLEDIEYEVKRAGGFPGWVRD